jgi:hypothetical protein
MCWDLEENSTEAAREFSHYRFVRETQGSLGKPLMLTTFYFLVPFLWVQSGYIFIHAQSFLLKPTLMDVSLFSRQSSTMKGLLHFEVLLIGIILWKTITTVLIDACSSM